MGGGAVVLFPWEQVLKAGYRHSLELQRGGWVDRRVGVEWKEGTFCRDSQVPAPW